MSNGGDHLSDPLPGVTTKRKTVASEELFEFRRNVGFGQIESVVTKKVPFDLREFALRRLNLAENIGNVL